MVNKQWGINGGLFNDYNERLKFVAAKVFNTARVSPGFHRPQLTKQG